MVVASQSKFSQLYSAEEQHAIDLCCQRNNIFLAGSTKLEEITNTSSDRILESQKSPQA